MSAGREDLAIVGAGIVGLAAGLAAIRRRPGLRLVLLEKEDRPALHQSGRNSGVVHSGLYYRPGSLKARLAVAGSAAMIRFCGEQGIPHSVCGKVVVAAAPDELGALEELRLRGIANGLAGLEAIGPERLRDIEPHCRGVRALHVPGTAITDFAAVAAAMARLLAAAGGKVRTGARVIGVRRLHASVVLETTAGAFEAACVVNCAGLHSDRIAWLAGDDPGCLIVPFRGDYRLLAGRSSALVRALVYPVPDPRFPFLGVHLSRTIGGAVEAGPNAVLAWKREGYGRLAFSPGDALRMLAAPGFWRMAARYRSVGLREMRRAAGRRPFLDAARRLVPEVGDRDLVAGRCGVRAQAIDREGRLIDDFHLTRAGRVLHVLNVPSPAATASLVIGRHVIDRLADALPPEAGAGPG